MKIKLILGLLKPSFQLLGKEQGLEERGEEALLWRDFLQKACLKS